MTSVTIDIGNTAIKAGVFENGSIQTVFRFENLHGLKMYCENLPSDIPILISSVTNDDLGSFYPYFPKLIVLDYTTKVPLIKKYKTPETLGNDRLAAAVGAWKLFSPKNNLVIDFGTCITYDFINYKGEYLGGSISPGVDTRFKALNYFTGKLPLLEKRKEFELTGDSTENAMLSGVMFGTLLEIQGFIDAYVQKNEDLQVIITGGDQAYFAAKLKGTIFAEPDLVLKGLFEILKYNVPQL